MPNKQDSFLTPCVQIKGLTTKKKKSLVQFLWNQEYRCFLLEYTELGGFLTHASITWSSRLIEKCAIPGGSFDDFLHPRNKAKCEV